MSYSAGALIHMQLQESVPVGHRASLQQEAFQQFKTSRIALQTSTLSKVRKPNSNSYLISPCFVDPIRMVNHSKNADPFKPSPLFSSHNQKFLFFFQVIICSMGNPWKTNTPKKLTSGLTLATPPPPVPRFALPASPTARLSKHDGKIPAAASLLLHFFSFTTHLQLLRLRVLQNSPPSRLLARSARLLVGSGSSPAMRFFSGLSEGKSRGLRIFWGCRRERKVKRAVRS